VKTDDEAFTVHVCTAHAVSERRACAALGVDRSSVRYRGRRAGDAAVRLCIRERVTQRRRFGYGRLHLFPTREGHHMNHKRFRRLYREEKLQVRRCGDRKRALGTRGNKKSDEFVRLVWWPQASLQQKHNRSD
jgi:putative transposase